MWTQKSKKKWCENCYIWNPSKCGLTYMISHWFAKSKFDSYDSLPPEKTFTLRYVILIIKSVFNKNNNHYYYNIVLDKCSNKKM